MRLSDGTGTGTSGTSGGGGGGAGSSMQSTLSNRQVSCQTNVYGYPAFVEGQVVITPVG